MITQITTVQIYDDTEELVANLEMMDSSSVTIEVNYCTNAAEWVKIAASVHKALLQMNLEGE
jgi:hypothetical protein